MPQWCDRHKQHTIDESCSKCDAETPGGLLNDLDIYIRHNAVLPSDHVGEGRVVSLSKLRGWVQRKRGTLR